MISNVIYKKNLHKLSTGSIILLWTQLLYSSEFTKPLSSMSLEEALTYNNEKIVYFGIGTATEVGHVENTERRIGRWQYLPTFIAQALKNNTAASACTNIERNWTTHNIQKLSAYATQQGIDQDIQTNPHIMRIVARDLKYSDAQSVEHYFRTVFNKGGVIVIGFFAPHQQLLWIPHLYNRLATEYPQSICLCVNTFIWHEGAQYSIYDILLMREYMSSLGTGGLVTDVWRSYKKNPDQALSWQQHLKKRVENIKEQLQICRTILNGMREKHNGISPAKAAALATSLGMPPTTITDDTICRDLLCRRKSGYITIPDYNFSITSNQHGTFKINDKHDMHRPDFDNLNLIAPRFKLQQFPSKFLIKVAQDIRQQRALCTNKTWWPMNMKKWLVYGAWFPIGLVTLFTILRQPAR